MKTLLQLLIGLAPVVLIGADSANDVLISQRNTGNSGNIQRNIPAAGAITSAATFRSQLGIAPLVSPAFTTPDLGVATATSLNGNFFTAGTYTLTGSAGKTLTFTNSLTLTGTDGTTMTFPTTTATIARKDAAQTFTGVQSFTSPDITTSLTSPSATFALLNVTPTTINFAGGVTTLNIGNASTTTNLLGSLLLNPAGTVAGAAWSIQGTAPAAPANSIGYYAPAAVTTGYGIKFPATITTGYVKRTGTSDPQTESIAATIPAADVASGALANGMTATTQSAGDNSTKVATTQYTDRAALTVPNAQTGTTYTLVAADGVASTAGVTMNNASANTLTIPANASVAFAIGTMIPVTQLGAGATTIAITSDTLNSNGTLLTIPGQYCTVVLHKIGATTWNAYGTGPIVTYPTTTAINTILWSSAANTIAALATANSGVLITSSGGVPSIATTLPSGLTVPAPVFSTGATASGSGAFNISGSSGAFIPSQTGGITGTTTNNSVNAGGVGEIVTSAVATGSAISLTTNTTANMTSISLTAGDWDVEANVNFNAGSATVTAMSAGITSTSVTVPSDGTECYSGALLTVTSAVDTITLPRKRLSLSGTTTVYAVGRATFSAGTDAIFGSMTARRVR